MTLPTVLSPGRIVAAQLPAFAEQLPIEFGRATRLQGVRIDEGGK